MLSPMKCPATTLPEAVRAAIAAQTNGGRVVVALSGGPDSSALLLALHETVPEMLAGAAHFHHGLRGADANADVSFCAGLCARLGVPLAVELGKVTPAGRSPQAAARADRYVFLETTCGDFDAGYLAVAHTADDQAETVLGRVLRGTSVDGLAGIPATRTLASGVTIVRPLLKVTRAEVESYCAERQITPRQDPSNAGTKYVRSRLRQAMPAIAANFNPRLHDALRRLSDNARVDSDYISAGVTELWGRAVVTHEPGTTISLSVAALVSAHPSLSRRVILSAIRAVYPASKPVEREEAATAAFVSALETVLKTGSGAVNLPGNVHAKLTHKRTLLTLAGKQENAGGAGN